MKSNIADEISKMTTIKLSSKDLAGQGSFADVYRYSIQNTEFALKCFQNEAKARKEDAVYTKI